MSFQSILDLFKQDNWSNELVGMVGKMLDTSATMFSYSMGVVIAGEPDTDPQVLIYDRDKHINKLERKIRRRIISRLSMRGLKTEIPTALIFMNVAKDCERIGDYIKNLHEIADMLPDNPDRQLYKDHLAGPVAAIVEMFADSHEAFQMCDEEMAATVIKGAKSQGREFEKSIREITASDMATNDAVCLVLILRFFKRLVAHMSNIATTVVMPVDLIDFYDEPEDDHTN